MHVNERHNNNNNNNYNKPHQYLRTSKDCNLLDLQRTFKGMHRSSEGINNYYNNYYCYYQQLQATTARVPRALSQPWKKSKACV